MKLIKFNKCNKAIYTPLTRSGGGGGYGIPETNTPIYVFFKTRN